MEAIEHTIRATRAESVEELDTELAAARGALAALETQKLDELEDRIRARVEEHRRRHGAMAIPRERRPIRDNPQA